MYSLIRADSPLLLDAAYQIRHQVYCVENKFLNQNPTERESDTDDERSTHVLIICQETDEIVGTARIIFPDPTRPLPIERSLEPEEAIFHSLPLQTTGELSRFAIPKIFRQSPFIFLRLITGLLGICLEAKISHVVAVMEPSFIRLTQRFGLEFQPIGGLVEYHGTRQPCMASISNLIDGVREKDSLLWPLWNAEILRVKNISEKGK